MTPLLNGWPTGSVSELAAWITGQYDLQARHPERGPLYQHYADLSQSLRETRPWQSLRYGASERCAIDYFPADAIAGAPAPLFVFLHGGFWRGGERATFHAIAKELLRAGISAAFVGYELAPAVSVTKIYQQVRTAVQHLFSQAGALGFDAGRVNLCGHSAGGHLVAMLASEQPSVWSGKCFDNVVPISGIFALEPMLLSPINHLSRITPEEATSLSPVLKHAFYARRFSVWVGEHETESFLAQSECFARHLQALGHDAHLHRVAGRHHFSIFKLFLDPDESMLRALIGQFNAFHNP